MPANIVVPEVGESIVDARVAKWLRKEGDAVSAGDPLVELETDKIDLEVGAPQAGVLSRIERKDGEDVKVGEVLGVIDESAASGASAAAAGADRRASRPRGEAPAETRSAKPRATPTAKKAAEQNDVDISQAAGQRRRRPRDEARRRARRRRAGAVAGTAASRLRRRRPRPKPGPPPSRRRRVRPFPSPRRRRAPPAPAPKSACACRSAARRSPSASSRRSSTAAMLTTFNEVDMSAVMALRERHKQTFKEKHGVGLGIASFFVKASIGALRAFPRLNAEIQGDEMVLKHYYDIGVAVGAAEGLVVPVLRDADTPGLCGHREADPRVREAGRGRHAVARGSEGRHVHDHQRRRVRIAAEHADPESAAGRDSRAAQDPGSADGRQRPGRRCGR